MRIEHNRASLAEYLYIGLLDKNKKLAKLNEIICSPDFAAYGKGFYAGCNGDISARLDGNLFLYHKLQDKDLAEFKLNTFVCKSDEQNNTLYSEGLVETMPDEDVLLHDGFYRGNKKIGCVAHGYFYPIYRNYSDKANEAVVLHEINREKAMEIGKDHRILMHSVDESLFNSGGNYGIIIPRKEKSSFFVVGKSVDDVIAGVLLSASHSLHLTDFLNKGFRGIDGSCDIHQQVK